MRKGIIRIVLGIVLLGLQLLSYIGNANTDNELIFQSDSLPLILYSLIGYLAYLSPGICGLVCLIFGVRAYKSEETAKLILHIHTNKTHKVLKYIFVSLLSLNLLYLVFFHLVLYEFNLSLSLLFMMLSLTLMILYFLFYQNKKPSFLFSTAMIFAGMDYLCSLLNAFLSVDFIISLVSMEENQLPLYLALELFPFLVTGVLYVVIGIMLYKEKFSPKIIRIIGAIAFASEMLYTIVERSTIGWAFIPFIADIILPLTIFVYTCIAPVSNKMIEANKEIIKEE